MSLDVGDKNILDESGLEIKNLQLSFKTDKQKIIALLPIGAQCKPQVETHILFLK